MLLSILDVLMGEQMILAILMIPVTLGAESEFQSLIIQLGSSADGTFMPCAIRVDL